MINYTSPNFLQVHAIDLYPKNHYFGINIYCLGSFNSESSSFKDCHNVVLTELIAQPSLALHSLSNVILR